MHNTLSLLEKVVTWDRAPQDPINNAIESYYAGKFDLFKNYLVECRDRTSQEDRNFVYLCLSAVLLNYHQNSQQSDEHEIRKITRKLTKTLEDIQDLQNMEPLDQNVIKCIVDFLALEKAVIVNRNVEARAKIQSSVDKISDQLDVDKLVQALEEYHLGGNTQFSFLLVIILKMVMLFPKIGTNIEYIIEGMVKFATVLETISDIPDSIIIHRNIGIQYHRIGQIHDAEKHFRTAYEKAKKINLEIEIFGLLNNMGVISRIASNYELAIQYYSQALTMTEQSEFAKQKGLVLNNLGAIFFYKNDLNQALKYYKDAEKFFINRPNTRIKGSTFDNIGEVFYVKGNYTLALDYYGKGLKIREELQLKDALPTSYDNIASIHRDRGDLDQALEYYKRSFDVKKEIGNPIAISQSWYNLAQIYKMKSDFETAIEYLIGIPKIWEDIGNRLEEMKSWFQVFLVYYDYEVFMEEMELKFDFNEIDKKIQEIYQAIASKEQEIPPEIIHMNSLRSIIILERSSKKRDKFKAILQLEELLPELGYNFNLYYRFSLLLLKLLIFELQSFYEEETKSEIWDLLSDLKDKAREQQAYPKIFQLGLLEAEMFLLNLDLVKTENLLAQLVLNSKEFGLDTLNTQINTFYGDFLDKKEDLLQLKLKAANIQEVITRSSIDSTIDKLTDETIDSSKLEKHYIPKMVLLIDLDHGTSIHSKNLDPDFSTNEILIGAILSAITSFMAETFQASEGLHRIEYGNNIALFSQEKNILFCHMLEGSAETGLSKLLGIKRDIMEDPEIWESLIKFKSNIKNNILERIDEKIENNF